MESNIIKCCIILLLASSYSVYSNDNLVNGNPIICDREAYNCPDRRNKNERKRLKNCADVFKVWNTCKQDIHGLDRDKDNKPCESMCSSYYKNFLK